MKIQILSIGKAAHDWVAAGIENYKARLPSNWEINLVEFPRNKIKNPGNIAALKQQEATKLLKATTKNSTLICLDPKGTQWCTVTLAKHLQQWSDERRTVSFIIGGPDGLDESCTQQADHVISLSKMIFPHQLVKITIMEQLYRAWSIMNNHPYHRE